MIAGLLGTAASAIILWLAPFPPIVRVALPLTYYLCYQYAVIARSYDLIPVLVLSCAALFRQAGQRPVLFTSLLCLMAAVSVHGMIMAISIGIAALAQTHPRKRFLPYAFAFAAVAALLTLLAWPAVDGTFVTHLNFSFGHFIEVSGKAFAAAFTGETFSSLAIVALTIPLLHRGGGLLFFTGASLLLCGVYAVVYSQVWHFGVLFLAWIFALWIASANCGADALVRKQPPGRKNDASLATLALAIVLAVQCYWTLCAVRYDWSEPYSGSLAAARDLRELAAAPNRIYGIGFACVAIQPYFPRNLFLNWSTAYWDWSTQNHINQDSLELDKHRPDYVMVGYKNEVERGIWTQLVQNSGYRAIRHFAGNSFWQTRRFEPESFDLYRRDSRQ